MSFLNAQALVGFDEFAGRSSRRVAARLWSCRLLLLFIALPTALATFYFGSVASPLYVTESKFVVRYLSPPASDSVSSALQSAGVMRSQDDTFSVDDFLQSRDALTRLKGRLPLQDFFSAEEADLFSRFPRFWDDDSFEALYRYYGARVQIAHNATSGITTLRTTAFRPQDAFALNTALIGFGRDLLNRLNTKAREDAVDFAKREVREAEDRLLEAQSAVTSFRNRELIVDPAKTSSSMLDLIARLTSELTLARARRAEIKAAAPDSITLSAISTRIEALEQQIERERTKLVGDENSVTGRMAGYERLVLARELANKSLAAATAALESARSDARRQQLYLEMIVAPNQPDEPTEPLRLKAVTIVFLVSSVGFLMIWLLLGAAREYLNR